MRRSARGDAERMKDDAHCAMGVISRGAGLCSMTRPPDASTAHRRAADGLGLAARRRGGRRGARGSASGWRRALHRLGSVRECEASPDFMRSSCKAACEREAARRQQATAIGEGVQRRVDWYLLAPAWTEERCVTSLLSGEQPIPPRYAFGVWFSRWWPYADWESRALLKEFDARGVPCDVLITDMDWHHTCYRRPTARRTRSRWTPRTTGRAGRASHSIASTLQTRRAFSAVQGPRRSQRVQSSLSVRSRQGRGGGGALDGVQPRDGPAALAKFAAFDPLNMSYSSHFHTHVLAPLERKGVDFWWLDWQQGEGLFGSSDVPEANPTWWLNYVWHAARRAREACGGHPHQHRHQHRHRHRHRQWWGTWWDGRRRGRRSETATASCSLRWRCRRQ